MGVSIYLSIYQVLHRRRTNHVGTNKSLKDAFGVLLSMSRPTGMWFAVSVLSLSSSLSCIVVCHCIDGTEAFLIDLALLWVYMGVLLFILLTLLTFLILLMYYIL